MKSTRPKFTISESESCTSMNTDSTNSSSAYLLCHRPNNLSSYQSDLSSYQNGRKSSLDTARSNQKYYGRNFSVIRETCQRCSENDFIESNTDCSSLECERGSDVYYQKCHGENSLYPKDRKCCSQQCQKLFTSFQTIKKIMIILSIFNVILLFTVVGLISGGVIFLFKSENPDIHVTTTTTTPSIQSKQINPNEKCEMKCKDLIYKLNLLDEIKSVQKECCTLNDAVNYFIIYINRNQRTKTAGNRPALQLKGGEPSNPPTKPINYLQNWKWDDLMRVKQDITYKDDIVIVLVSGHYFLYSKIHIRVKIKDGSTRTSGQMPLTHALYRRQIGGIFKSLQSSVIKCSIKQNTTVHSSVLEGTAYLRVGEELKIGLTHSDHLEFHSKNDNYFGLFKL